MSIKKRHLLVTVALAVGLASPAFAAPQADTSGSTTANPSQVSYEEAVPAVAPANADAPAVYLDSSGQVIPMPGTGRAAGSATEAAPLAACTPVSGRDNPHRSSTGVAVSGHGWWGRGTCSGDLADVYNCLYEYYTDGTWRQKACSDVERLRPGTGGSSYRTVARESCDATNEQISWRNHVDVDVVGEGDTSEWPYRQAEVYCTVN